MEKNRILGVLLLALMLPVCGSLRAQITDSQIMTYATQAISQGKSNAQIGQELISRGATVEQLEALLGRNGVSQSDVTSASERKPLAGIATDVSHVRTEPVEMELDRLVPMPVTDNVSDGIFGHDMFSTSGFLSFEPNENQATPQSYVLGPGDELIIDIWGESEATIKSKISAEGRINIAQIGPVQLSGLTIGQATAKLKKVLSQKYMLSGSDAQSQISVTLGNLRSIKINVLGEVKVPGTYRLSSLSTVFNALYRAGGVTPIGSLRNVMVVRAGKTVATLDLYDFLFEGSLKNNISLADDDAVIVPSYYGLVTVGEGVKRPMIYESVQGETVDRIIRYAGGFTSKANPDEVVIQRQNGEGGAAVLVGRDSFDKFVMNDGDNIIINSSKDVPFENSVTVVGSVMRPGKYAIGDRIATVRQLLEHAGGLLPDAFQSRAQIVRELPDRSHELLSIAIGAVADGTADDVMLKRNDILTVFNVNEIELKGDVSITGYVNNPGGFQYSKGMGIEDLILLAGGLKEGASAIKVEVSRRIICDDSMSAQDTLAQIFSFDISGGLMPDGKPVFTLEPYDIVSVRKSPVYVPQKQVKISGEVNFPGYYTLETANERLSDLMRRAGGATQNAYVRGALLKRKVTQSETDADIDLLALARNEADSANISVLDVPVYNVGIDLEKAMDKPGSDYDVVLGDGDELILPPMVNIVRIRGEVQYPNAVNYMPGMSVRDYIRQAGGFSNDACRHKVYVIYLNGKVAKGRFAKVYPGSDIIVPNKPERSELTVGEWVGIGSTVASLSTVVITLISLYR